MTPLQITLITLQGILFFAWAFTMFQTLFRVRALAVERTRNLWPGPRASASTLAVWWRDPTQRPLRNRLILLTLLLFGTMALSALAGGVSA